MTRPVGLSKSTTVQEDQRMQHVDPRLAQQQMAPQFPPPGFVGEQAPHHLAPEHTPAPTQTWPPATTTSGFLVAGEGTSGDESETEDYGDYFGFDQRHKYMMPDGKLWIEFKILNEGDIARFQQILNRDITVEKRTGNARIRVNQVEERHALLMVAVTGWHMMRREPKQGGRWVEQKFSNGSPGSEFMKWVQLADPRLVADLENAIRKHNPFLLQASTETLEAIDKQVAELQEQRQEILERMRGEGSSATS
jgi:hypothetical protein